MKIGIAGLGFMGATHLQAIGKMPDITLGAVCTTNQRAREGDLTAVGGNLPLTAAMHDFTAVRKYADWKQLAMDPELDAIDICLPTDFHADVAIAAMAAGKHVLCEKPMALTEADCERMLAASEKHRRVLMIGHVLRFWPEYEILYDFVKSEKHGAVRTMEFSRSAGLPDWSRWLPVEERSGGAVVDLLIHDIDQALSLFGMPEQVSGTSTGPVDTIDGLLLYRNGTRVAIKGGWRQAGEPFQMGFRAEAEHGILELSAAGFSLTDATGQHTVEAPKDDAYLAELRYFADCCESGRELERCPPAQSAQALKLAEFLKESRKKEGQLIRCLD